MVKRIKKVIPLLFRHRQLAISGPNFDRSEFVEIDSVPLLRMFGMWAHYDAYTAHERVIVAPHSSKPAPYNPNLIICDLARRTQICNERRVRLKTESMTESRAIGGWCPIEPTIEKLRPRN